MAHLYMEFNFGEIHVIADFNRFGGTSINFTSNVKGIRRVYRLVGSISIGQVGVTESRQFIFSNCLVA